MSGTATRQAIWTVLGSQMGYTNNETKRAAVRDAAAAIDWTDQPATVAQLHCSPVRMVAAGIFFGRSQQLRRAGTAALTLANGVQVALVGLEDARDRYYLLDLGHEALYVLRETGGQSWA
jgi:hypothetical protein